MTSSEEVGDAIGLTLDSVGRLDVVCNVAGIGGDNRWLSDEAVDRREVIEIDQLPSST